jgi:hypothetical protein
MQSDEYELSPLEEDTSVYLKGRFINAKSIGDEVLDEEVVDTGKSKFNRPVLIFRSGDKFSLNDANLRVVHKAWGTNPKGWIGKRVRLVRGERERNDGTMEDCVLLTPISPQTTAVKVDDEIPF